MVSIDTKETNEEMATRLRQELNAMPNAEDVIAVSDSERNAIESHRYKLGQRLGTLRNAPKTLANLAPGIDAAERWLADITRWREALSTELLALDPNPQTNYERGVQQNVLLSIRVIDTGLGVLFRSGYNLTTLRLGALMRADGVVPVPVVGEVYAELPWYGGTDEVQHRLKNLRTQRATQQEWLAEARKEDGAVARNAQIARAAVERQRAMATGIQTSPTETVSVGS